MIVIADSSALIALSICESLPILDALFGKVLVPQAVYDEVCIAGKAESQILSAYLQDKISNIGNDRAIEKSHGLGKGELAAMSLYKQLSADLLLIDDAAARKVAYINNLEVMGSLGVLLLAKQNGLIPLVRPFVDRLRSSDIFISENLLQKLLVIANEIDR